MRVPGDPDAMRYSPYARAALPSGATCIGSPRYNESSVNTPGGGGHDSRGTKALLSQMLRRRVR